MSNDIKTPVVARISAPSSSKSVIGGQVTESGQEHWFIISEGRQERLVTSSSSASSMDEAMVIYANALKELAKR